MTLLLLVLVVAPLAGAANNVVPPVEPTLYLRYGKDAHLEQSDVNLAFRADGCSPTSPSTACDGNQLAGTASARVRRSSVGTTAAEGGVGFRYQVNQSCNAQTLRGLPTVDLTFDHVLRAAPGAAPATATASIQSRLATINEAPLVANTTAPLPSTTMSGSNVHAVRSFATFQWNVTYDTTLGAKAEVRYLNDDIGSTAEANASLTVKRLDLLFGDVTPPTFTSSTGSADATPEEPTSAPPAPDFQGWYQAPVTVTVTSTDPDNSDPTKAATEPISCVGRVVFHDTDTNEDHTELPGWGQVPVTATYGDDRKVLLDLLVYDEQGNQALVQHKHFGVDQTPPTTSNRTYPASPSGDGGWVKRFPANASLPKLWLACSDHTVLASQCEEVRRLEGASNASVPTSEQDGGAGFNVPEGVHAFTFRSKDHAGNWESGSTLLMMVDITPPQVNLTPDATSGPDATWFPRELNVTVACWDATSGCATATLDVGEGAGPQPLPSGPVPVRGEGVHRFNWSATDGAGNGANGSRNFNVDLTDPGTPNVTSPAHNAYFNTTFLFRWDPVVDVPSGTFRYDTRVDNGSIVSVTPPSTSRSLGLGEGRRCMQVRAVDRAGRLGAWSPLRCVTVDRTNPSVVMEKPAGGKLTIFGNETAVPGLPSDKALVLGPFTARVVATDALSGIDRIRIKDLQPASDPGAVTCAVSPCERAFNGTGILSPPQLLKLEGRAWDKAQNQFAVTRDVVQAVLLASTAPAGTSGVPTGSSSSSSTSTSLYSTWKTDLAWLPLDHGTFSAYEVHRSSLPDFVPSAVTLVATVTDPSVTRYQEAGILGGQEYYYRVRYVTTEWFVDSHVNRVNTYDDGGGAGEPGECGTLGCQELDLSYGY